MAFWQMRRSVIGNHLIDSTVNSDNRYIEYLSQVIGLVLREPSQRANEIAIATANEARRSQEIWRKLSTMNASQAKELADRIDFTHLTQIADYLNTSQRGAIFTGTSCWGLPPSAVKAAQSTHDTKKYICFAA
jgi:hypothetical protein